MKASLQAQLIEAKIEMINVRELMHMHNQAPIAITFVPSQGAVTTATTATTSGASSVGVNPPEPPQAPKTPAEDKMQDQVNASSMERLGEQIAGRLHEQLGEHPASVNDGGSKGGDGDDSEMTEAPYVDPDMFENPDGLLSKASDSSKDKTTKRRCGAYNCTFGAGHMGNCSFVTLGKRNAHRSSTTKKCKSFADVMANRARLQSCQSPGCKQPRNHLGLCTEDTTRTKRRKVDLKNRNCEGSDSEDDDDDDFQKDDDVQDEEQDQDVSPNKKHAAELELLADEMIKGLKRWERIFSCDGERLEFMKEGSRPLCTEFFSGSGMMTQCVMKLHANLGKLQGRKLFTVDSSVVPSAIDIPAMELLDTKALNQPYTVNNYKADAVFGQQDVLYEHMSRLVYKLAIDNYEISIVWKNLYESKWAAVFKWFGFPCTTFSRLSQKRHRRNATNGYLGKSPEALEANKLLRDIVVSLKTINNGTFCFENPECSFVNHPVVQAMTQPDTTQLGFGARIVRLSFCAFGTPYRKNTVLLTNNPRIVEFFEGDTAYCGCGNRKACRFTGVSHTRLAGSAEETGNMISARTNMGDGTRFVQELKNMSLPAKQAEQYPERFCMAIAELVYTQTPIEDVRRKFQECEVCVVSE